MDWLKQAIDIFFHLDKHLNEWAEMLGPWLYVVLFLIVFCETGLVVTPFLPGDSLLFAVGALAASHGSSLNPILLIVVLSAAAIIGDAVNYAIGAWAGPKVFSREHSRLLSKKHLLYTHRFYEKHGGKTIILARFMPIVRTFAPFVAGIGGMNYGRFAVYNVTGGVAWVVTFLCGGYWFGNIAFVKRQFHYVILGIIVISVIPALIEFVRAWRAERQVEKLT